MARPRQARSGSDDADRLWAEIKRQHYRPVYVLEGEETLRLENVAAHLRDALLTPAEQAFGHHAFDGDTADFGAVLRQALSFPMLAARQMVWLKQADRCLAGAEQEAALELYLASPPAKTVLVMTAAKLDGRRRWVKQVKAAGLHFLLAPPRGAALVEWVMKAARQRGLPLDAEGAELLVDQVGGDLRALESELDKLALVAEEAGVLPAPSSLRDLVLAQRQIDPFELVKLLGQGDPRRAIALWRRWAAEGRSPYELAPLLAWRMRQLSLVRSLLLAGHGEREAAQAAGVPPFAAGAICQAAGAWPPEALGAALEACLDCERGLKASPLRPELVLEKAILEICLAAG